MSGRDRTEMMRAEGRREQIQLHCPLRCSSLSWAKQSRSPQRRKTNGGKLQPGGFDSLKGLWDLITIQLFCVRSTGVNTCFEMCHACIWSKALTLTSHTLGIDVISDSLMNAVQESTLTCMHVYAAVRCTPWISCKGSESSKNIQLIAPWLHR